MSYIDLYEHAKSIATLAHKGVKRKITKEPYINHPIRVAEAVAAKFSDRGFETLVKAVAVLHDVLEDTDWTEAALRAADIPRSVISVVKVLSRNPDENYFSFIRRIAKGNNRAAKWVKIEDLKDNMRDLPEGTLKDKYRFALHMLENHL